MAVFANLGLPSQDPGARFACLRANKALGARQLESGFFSPVDRLASYMPLSRHLRVGGSVGYPGIPVLGHVRRVRQSVSSDLKGLEIDEGEVTFIIEYRYSFITAFVQPLRGAEQCIPRLTMLPN